MGCTIVIVRSIVSAGCFVSFLIIACGSDEATEEVDVVRSEHQHGQVRLQTVDPIQVGQYNDQVQCSIV